MDLSDIACEPPGVGEIGDEWICPDCALKWNYTLFVDEDESTQVEAWFTNEIG